MALQLLIISGAVQRLRTFVSFWFIIPRAFILLYLPFNISAAIFRSFQVVILITIISTRAVRKISRYFHNISKIECATGQFQQGVSIQHKGLFRIL